MVLLDAVHSFSLDLSVLKELVLHQVAAAESHMITSNMVYNYKKHFNTFVRIKNVQEYC